MGKFWQPIYGFHLRHHAVTDCNESISGCFGLPLGDWMFGTCVIPQTVYAQGEEWTPDKFRSPQPRQFIRGLDAWANKVVHSRRARAALERKPDWMQCRYQWWQLHAFTRAAKKLPTG